jgi:hypothetical protein
MTPASLRHAEQRAWDRLRLHVADQPMAELLDLAETPLDLDPDDRPVTISNTVLAEIRAHALNVPLGYEVVGALVVRHSDNVVIRYHRLENLATEPRRFRVRCRSLARWGESEILIHSHAPPGLATPSKHDLSGTTRERLAIYHLASGRIGVFTVSPDRRSWETLQVISTP